MNFFLKLAALIFTLLTAKLYFRTCQQKFDPLAVAVQIPFIGGFFVEAHLEALLKDKNWKKVLEVTETSMKGVIANKSYMVWYYKGMAECATYQFAKCEESAIEASFRAPKQFINYLLAIVNTMKNKEEKQQIRERGVYGLSEF